MKKVKMIITSVVVLAIVGSAFAFNAKRIGEFCVTTANGSGNCYTITQSKRTTATDAPVTLKYIVDWDGAVCGSSSPCNTQSKFTDD
jgi:hypothetical protein